MHSPVLTCIIHLRSPVLTCILLYSPVLSCTDLYSPVLFFCVFLYSSVFSCIHIYSPVLTCTLVYSSIAIVLAEGSDNKVVYSNMRPDHTAFNWCRMEVADWWVWKSSNRLTMRALVFVHACPHMCTLWLFYFCCRNYCNLSKAASEGKSAKQLLKSVISTYPSNPDCDQELMARVMYDAQVTRSIHGIWQAARLSRYGSWFGFVLSIHMPRCLVLTFGQVWDVMTIVTNTWWALAAACQTHA